MFTLEELSVLDRWEFFPGVAGLWYARNRKSSPPDVRGPATLGDLQERIVRGEPPPWRQR
jgi:hypothetical protein